jgi:hypothetical protein
MEGVVREAKSSLGRDCYLYRCEGLEGSQGTVGKDQGREEQGPQGVVADSGAGDAGRRDLNQLGRRPRRTNIHEKSRRKARARDVVRARNDRRSRRRNQRPRHRLLGRAGSSRDQSRAPNYVGAPQPPGGEGQKRK